MQSLEDFRKGLVAVAVGNVEGAAGSLEKPPKSKGFVGNDWPSFQELLLLLKKQIGAGQLRSHRYDFSHGFLVNVARKT